MLRIKSSLSLLIAATALFVAMSAVQTLQPASAQDASACARYSIHTTLITADNWSDLSGGFIGDTVGSMTCEEWR